VEKGKGTGREKSRTKFGTNYNCSTAIALSLDKKGWWLFEKRLAKNWIVFRQDC